MNSMEGLQNIIPVEFDLFSFFILGAIVLGVTICLSIGMNRKPENKPMWFLGGFLLCLVLMLSDFYICHTGLLPYMIWAYNSTEIFGLLCGPFLYFFVLHLFPRKGRKKMHLLVHIILPTLYILPQIAILIRPETNKLIDYIYGFHPGLIHEELLTAYQKDTSWFRYVLYVTRFIHYLIIGSLFLYFVLTIKHLRSIFPMRFLRITPKLNKHTFSVALTTLFIIAIVATALVFSLYDDDTGEKYVMIILSMGIYFVHFTMLNHSRFFDNVWVREKYASSGFSHSELQLVKKIKEYIVSTQYVLRSDGSLKDLAQRMEVPATYISQAINKQTHKNYNDFINHYRIAEAKKRLTDPNFKQYTIETIGKSVGFISKSAFYQAFKKETQRTPAQFAKQHKTS